MQVEKIIDYITNWLSIYIKKSGLSGFIVGISGGIDSAVTSTLCALTGEHVRVLHMPILQTQEKKTYVHINWLKENFPNVVEMNLILTPLFEQIKATFPPEIQDDLTMANSQSRLRMLTLYAFAGHYRLLVVGTGNKIEDFGIGFYTKYGDGGVDISPIADLMKSEVFILGEAMGINPDILNAEPNDGLWEDNRTDESQIGASYTELEWAMNFQKKQNIIAKLTSREKEVLRLYNKLHRINQHKMTPIPICNIPRHLKK